MGFILVYVTHGDMESARKVAAHLLEKKLVACANFFPIRSAYWWRGKLKHSDEVVSILKTRKANWRRVKKEVESIHPYDVPCIIRIDAEANRSYENWIRDETR